MINNIFAYLLISFAFLSGAAFAYVLFRFLLVILSVDAAIARGIKELLVFQSSNSPIVGGHIVKPDDGDFQPMTDEEAAIAEAVRKAKEEGLTDQEIEHFIRQGVSDSV